MGGVQKLGRGWKELGEMVQWILKEAGEGEEWIRVVKREKREMGRGNRG